MDEAVDHEFDTTSGQWEVVADEQDLEMNCHLTVPPPPANTNTT